MRSLRALVVIAVVTSAAPALRIAHAAEPSLADKASARDLFNEGVALRDKGDAKGALVKFQTAYALWPSPSTGLELGRTHMILGELIEARERFLETAKLPKKPTETEAAQAARNEAQELAGALQPRIAQLRFQVSGAPAGSTVRVLVDGNEVPAGALGAARKVNPGKHTIVASAGASHEISLSLDVKEGESRDIALSFPPETGASDAAAAPPAVSPPPATAPPPAPPPVTGDASASAASSGSMIRTAGLLVLGAGGLTLGVGAVLGLTAKGAYSEARDAHCPEGMCDPEGKRLTEDARSRGTVATIVFGVGAALAVGGAVLWLTAPSDTTSEKTKAGVTGLGFGLGTVSLGGRF